MRFSVPFWTFEIYFFLNRRFSFETSNSDFCDQLNKIFHINKKNLKKIKIAKVIWKLHIDHAMNVDVYLRFLILN